LSRNRQPVDVWRFCSVISSTLRELYLLDGTGKELDTIAIPAETRASPTISNGAIYLGAPDGVVYAFE